MKDFLRNVYKNVVGCGESKESNSAERNIPSPLRNEDKKIPLPTTDKGIL